MKTADGVEYVDGMTLWYVRDDEYPQVGRVTCCNGTFFDWCGRVEDVKAFYSDAAIAAHAGLRLWQGRKDAAKRAVKEWKAIVREVESEGFRQ